MAIGISCGSPPSGQVGVPYTHTFPTTGVTGTPTFSIVAGSLPPGLTLNTLTGVVSGSPTTPGTFSFTVRVVQS